MKKITILYSIICCFYSFTALGQGDSTAHEDSDWKLFEYDKVDFSWKKNVETKRYHFSLGYRLFLCKELPPFADLRGWPTNFMGPVLTTQAVFGEKTLFTPKLGYRLSYDGLTLQADVGLNTDFKKTSYSISPQIGLSLAETIGIYYEYDFQVGRERFEDIGKHRFGLFMQPAVPYVVLTTILVPYAPEISHRVDFSLKQNEETRRYNFSLAYRLFLRSSDFTAGPVLTTQAVFGKKTLFTPKLGYRATFFNDVLGFQLDGGLNTDFKQVSYSITPGVSLSFMDAPGIYYEHDFQNGKHRFDDIGKHRFGIFIAPFDLLGFLNPRR